MHRLAVYLISLASFCSAQTAPLVLPEIKTKSGKTYTQVSITQKLPDGVKIMHSAGLARLYAEDLPDDVVQKLGGFETAKMREHREAEEKEAQRRIQLLKEAKAKENLDRSAYEPLPSLIDKLAADAPYEADKKRLRLLRYYLEILQKTCQPLLRSGKIDHPTVKAWVNAVIDSRVEKGMPYELALLSKGTPSSENKTNGIPTSASWQQPNGRLFMVFLDDTLHVKSWYE